MSKIGKNIRKIRTVKKLSQASFAQIFNLARPSVGAYEEGRAEPKIDTVIQIANYFNLSIDSLLIKDLTINDLYRFDSLKKKTAVSSETSAKTRKNISRNLNTRIITFQTYLEYIHHYKNDDFVDNLPAFHFPEIETAPARAFEIGDDSMAYENAGIEHHDIVIGDKKIKSKEELHIGHVYILVLKDNILIRRLSAINKKLKFIPDNPDWRNIFLDFGNIHEIWEVSYLWTKNLLPPIRISKRMNQLEDEVEKLSKNLKSMEKLFNKK